MTDRSKHDADITDGLNIIQHAANLSLVHDLAVMTRWKDRAVATAQGRKQRLAVLTAQLIETTLSLNAATDRVERAAALIRNLERENAQLHRLLAEQSCAKWGAR